MVGLAAALADPRSLSFGGLFVGRTVADFADFLDGDPKTALDKALKTSVPVRTLAFFPEGALNCPPVTLGLGGRPASILSKGSCGLGGVGAGSRAGVFLVSAVDGESKAAVASRTDAPGERGAC